MYNLYNNTIEHCKENNICRVRELMMSNHRYRQKSQVKERDETKEKKTLYMSQQKNLQAIANWNTDKNIKTQRQIK